LTNPSGHFSGDYISAVRGCCPLRFLYALEIDPGYLAKLDISRVRVLSSCLRFQDTARDLGVVIDSQLSPSAHVAAVCRSGYYQLRQLRQAVRSLSEDASKTLVQAFVSCRHGLL